MKTVPMYEAMWTVGCDQMSVISHDIDVAMRAMEDFIEEAKRKGGEWDVRLTCREETDF